jgi:hypothetical protein
MCFLTFSHSDIATASEALSGCPSTWNTKLPKLEIQSHYFAITGTNDKKLIANPNYTNSDGIKYQYFTSSYGAIWLKNKLGAEIEKSNWNWIVPEFAATLKSLDKSAIFTSEYQRSYYSDFHQLVKLPFEDLNFPVTSGALRTWYDVSNKSWIRVALTIETERCPTPFTFYSNAVEFTEISDESIDIEKYLKFFGIQKNAVNLHVFK